MASSSNVRAFKSLYLTMIFSREPTDSPAYKDHIRTLVDLVKNDLTGNEIGHLLESRVKYDRVNTELYISPSDRSKINREIHIGHIKLRNYLFINIVTTVSLMIMVAVSFFYIDLHAVLVNEGVHLFDYMTYLKRVTDTLDAP